MIMKSLYIQEKECTEQNGVLLITVFQKLHSTLLIILDLHFITNKSPTTKQHVKLILTCTVWQVRLGDKWAGWSWRPVALQQLQTEFDSLLALIEGSTLYQMCYTHRWISRGSYRLISDRTCGKCPSGGTGRHGSLRSCKLRVRLSPWVQNYTQKDKQVIRCIEHRGKKIHYNTTRSVMFVEYDELDFTEMWRERNSFTNYTVSSNINCSKFIPILKGV